MTTAPFLDDLTRIRVRTRAYSAANASAVAAGGSERRATVLQLLNDVLASELIWLMRYRRRFLLRGGDGEFQADRNESTPADRIARRIVELGGRPDLDPDNLLSKCRSHYASRGSLADRVREDLRAEQIVIETYDVVIGYLGTTDPPTRAMLEANRSRERARATHLSEILREIESPGKRQIVATASSSGTC
jgi:bacterioferritin